MRDPRWWVLPLLLLAVACTRAGGDSTAASATAQSGAANPAATAARAPAATEGTGTGAPAASPEKQFPSLDTLQQIPYAYRVANEHPELLAKIPCYCPCELYGHGGVIDCYRSQHAARCATCLEEAVVAGRMLEQAGGRGSPELYEQIAAQVKNRYRSAIVRSHLERNDYPDLQGPAGRAYLTVCSDCHQPPHPAMYSGDGWRRSLARMDAYAKQRGVEVDAAQWQAAVEYVRSASKRYPPEAGERYRADLANAVEHLKRAEGESVYYPGSQDETLDPAWFERMVGAYRLARGMPAELLAQTQIDDPDCSNLLECLNSTAAITSEAAVEAIYRLAEQRRGGD